MVTLPPGELARLTAIHEKNERAALEAKAATAAPGSGIDARNHLQRQGASARATLEARNASVIVIRDLEAKIGDEQRRIETQLAEIQRQETEARAKYSAELAADVERTIYPIAKTFVDDPTPRTARELMEAWLVLDVRARAELGSPISTLHLALAFTAGIGADGHCGHDSYFDGEQGPGAWAHRLERAIASGVFIEVYAVGIELLRAVHRARQQHKAHAHAPQRTKLMRGAVTHADTVDAMRTPIAASVDTPQPPAAA